MVTGVFISFEGIDGAGKSTHIDTLRAEFERQGRAVTVTREPGGTELAEQLRALVLQMPMDALTEALLVFAARRDHLVRVIEPALASGAVVLCDRFTDSSFAYQGGGQGLSLDVLGWLERKVQDRGEGAGLRQPDLSLWFDLPPALAAERLARARTPDKFEAKGVDFFARVAAGYQARASADPTRFARVAADLPREQVWAQVRTAVQAAGWLA